MRQLTLDINKWRCGGKGEEGVTALRRQYDTELRNPAGYMCCLGQFALQLGISEEDITNRSCPMNLERKIPILTKKLISKSYDGRLIHGIRDTKFSDAAISINDNNKTTIAEKVKQLKALCGKFKIKLKVKGKIPNANGKK